LSQFEFSIVIASIVIAIAITEILATWGRMIRHRRRFRPYWVHIGWMALVLLLAVQFWWSLWELRDWPDWSFFEYMFSLVPFLTLVVMTFLLCPDPAMDGHDSLESYYFEHSTWFFGLGGVFLVQLMLVNPLLRGEPWLGPENGIRLLALAAVVPLARTESRRVHAGALLACLVLFAVFVVIGTAASG
jgi:hypothetical protein